jgi:hypothetical protein
VDVTEDIAEIAVPKPPWFQVIIDAFRGIETDASFGWKAREVGLPFINKPESQRQRGNIFGVPVPETPVNLRLLVPRLAECFVMGGVEDVLVILELEGFDPIPAVGVISKP